MTQTTEIDPPVGISRVEVEIGRERSTIYRDYMAGKFPRPSYLLGRRVWRLSEVRAWVAKEWRSSASF